MSGDVNAVVNMLAPVLCAHHHAVLRRRQSSLVEADELDQVAPDDCATSLNQGLNCVGDGEPEAI